MAIISNQNVTFRINFKAAILSIRFEVEIIHFSIVFQIKEAFFLIDNRDKVFSRRFIEFGMAFADSE